MNMTGLGLVQPPLSNDNLFLRTFGFCGAPPLIFLGAPSMSKEWLRTLIALYKD